MKSGSYVTAVGLGLIALLAFTAHFSPCSCEEGMWLPQDLPDNLIEEMHLKGLELNRDEIYNTSGTGIANAVVRVGATGSFVSPEGLILTNHHVAFGAVQRLSTPERNYIEQGFLARTREDEVPAYGYIVYVIQSTEDVTERVLAAADASMTPLKRYNAIERRTKEIIREGEEEGEDIYCDVSTFFGGSRYVLYRFLKIKDVRVVYVPSRAIGEYGGDIDNWMWPRHTGDFSFLRAYVGPDGKTAEFSEANVPYRPESYLKIAPEGLRDGDLAVIIGFPGRTHRYLTSHALAQFEDFEYPERIRLYRQMIGILEKQSVRDPLAAVRVASKVKGMNNRLKNNEGMLEGFRRFNLVERGNEKELKIKENFEHDRQMARKYEALLEGYGRLYREQSEFAMKDMILDFMLGRGSLVAEAMLLYKCSVEKQKDDLDRDPDFMDRRIPDLKRRLRFFQFGFHRASDRELLKMFLEEMAGLPRGQRVRAVDDIFGGKTGKELERAHEAFLDRLYANTNLDHIEDRLQMFDMSHEALIGQDDSFVDLAAKLFEENEERRDRRKSFYGSLSILTPQWIEIVARGTGEAPYPDANGTMRLNYGVVKGYSPKDEVYYRAFTTLEGVAEKNTGVPPFNCPERILELAAARNSNTYADPGLGDVPVDILTTHDSTGGNSGSPVVNARGELVGCLFDGNYEAMTSDFLFQDDLTRSISVDIRYVLFIADMVDSAQNVLEELGVK